MEIIEWMNLLNENPNGINSNPNIIEAIELTKMRLYGDAELNIYIIKNWNSTLVNFYKYIAEKVGNDWIKSSIYLDIYINIYDKTLVDILNECGSGFNSVKEQYNKKVKKMIKNKLNGNIWNLWLPVGHFQCKFNECIQIKNDGNFKLFASRIGTTFYLICFATS